jgi:hypothetical protein
LTVLIGFIPEFAPQLAQFPRFAPGVASSLNQCALMAVHIPFRSVLDF